MISVLMAVKTGWQYMPEAVASVRVQSYTDWELLIGINGHSETSDAAKLAQSLQTDKIKAFVLDGCTNKPQALTQLVEVSQGDRLAILDADDIWLPAKLSMQLPLLSQYDVVGTGAEYFGNYSGTIPVEPGLQTFKQLLAVNNVVNSSVVMPKGLTAWVNTDGIDDYPLWLKLAYEGRRIFVMPEILTRIRCHGDQWFAKHDDSAEVRARWSKFAK